ncbi:tetratricopeptide repeat protein [Campylobacter sputorum]|uniref:tetratricopeptide repeat protein n=1 Tax=Campylobacter sputorum TaxID=206 RepID=UPI00053BF02D|nr:tetratricopeptide repeat protein [Campylobacter sputorum]
MRQLICIKNAFNYAKKGCDLDDKTACRKLGMYYISGKGTKQNVQKGYNYLIRACEKLNNGDSCSLLGFLFKEAKKYQSALKYFTRGCDLDSAESCVNLTYLYSYGLGTNMDMKKAFDYSKKACLYLGDGLSCGSLGFILMGNESKDSRTAAKKFFGICCATTKAKECCNEHQNLDEQGY